MADPFDLQRFVTAQDGVIETAMTEIAAGRKRSHWMWFVFPQIAGLGHSAMAQRYAIGSIEEAQAYLAHRVLGPRLIACIERLQALENGTADTVFGPVDAMKLRSSLTLFEAAGGPAPIGAALARWFDGARDAATLRLLGE